MTCKPTKEMTRAAMSNQPAETQSVRQGTAPDLAHACASLMEKLAVPAASAKMFPRSPTCRFVSDGPPDAQLPFVPD